MLLQLKAHLTAISNISVSNAVYWSDEDFHLTDIRSHTLSKPPRVVLYRDKDLHKT